MIKLKDILNENTEITEYELLTNSSSDIIDSFKLSVGGFNNKEEAAEYLDWLKLTHFPAVSGKVPSK